MSRYYGDKECPSNPMEARREGERARSYDRNPYEHGRYSMDYDCERAYKEFERGREQAAFERRDETRREEEAAAREAQRRDFERQQYARAEEEERMHYEQMEAEQARDAEAAQPSSDAAGQSNQEGK